MSGPTPPWLRSLIMQYLGILNSLAHLGPAVQDFFPKRRNAPVHCDIHFRPWKNQLRLQQTQRRCGEMADATDLKSVRASSSVWVRIPSSASLKSQFAREQSGKLTNLRLRTVPQRKARKRSLFDNYSPSVDSGSLEWRRVGAF